MTPSEMVGGGRLIRQKRGRGKAQTLALVDLASRGCLPSKGQVKSAGQEQRDEDS